MFSIVILAVSIAAILWVLQMKPAAEGPAVQAESDIEGVGSKARKPFILPEWGRMAALFIGGLAVGSVVSQFLGPVIVFLLLGAAAFFLYYRTEKGRANTLRAAAALKDIAGRTAESAKVGAKNLAEGVSDVVAKQSAAAPPAQTPREDAGSIDQVADQLVSAAMVVRSMRRTLDTELLPNLAKLDDGATQNSVVASAVKNLQLSISQARNVADAAIVKLMRFLTSDPQSAKDGLATVLARQDVAADAALTSFFQQILASQELARFDEAGFRKLLDDLWVRTTENADLSNSPI